MANRNFALDRAQKQDERVAAQRLAALRVALALAATQAKEAAGVADVAATYREGARGVCINCGESIQATDEVAIVLGTVSHYHKVVHVECIKETDQLAC